MEAQVFSGRFVIQGKQPDGDSIRFIPDDRERLSSLPGMRPGALKEGQSVQLRFQGIDSPELHYTGGTQQPFGAQARNRLLDRMGFGAVIYSGVTVVGSTQDLIPGFILTSQAETHGRPIAYALLKPEGESLGLGGLVKVALGRLDIVEASMNYFMLDIGMAYYLAYDSMDPAERDLFHGVALRARTEGRGMWSNDKTSSFLLVDDASINGTGQLVFPKLFRRCTDYLRHERSSGVESSFLEWLTGANEPGKQDERDDLVYVNDTAASPRRLSELIAETPQGLGRTLAWRWTRSISSSRKECRIRLPRLANRPTNLFSKANRNIKPRIYAVIHSRERFLCKVCSMLRVILSGSRYIRTMAEQTLRSAQIAFYLPQGDDKDTDTKVSVTVSTKFNNQFDLQLASKINFAGTDTWEDDGNHTYTYTLDAVSVALSQISSDVKTTINIQPNGNDTVKFNYTLTLVFDDGNPDTAQIVLTQSRSDITLSQDNRTYTS